MIYHSKTFNELTTIELYNILKLRADVFVMEQEILYLDMDDKDQKSYHLYGEENGQILTYSRILPKGVSYPEYCSIGRVCNHLSVRGQKLGRGLMEKSIEKCKEYFPEDKIKISAQCYLLKFYTDLGFDAIGEPYIEEDIMHQAMVYRN